MYGITSRKCDHPGIRKWDHNIQTERVKTIRIATTCENGDHQEKSRFDLAAESWSHSSKWTVRIKPTNTGWEVWQTGMEANRKAWITGDIFWEGLTNFNVKMQKKKRHVLLLLDNAPCHPFSVLHSIMSVESALQEAALTYNSRKHQSTLDSFLNN